jgi:hypothetical protein
MASMVATMVMTPASASTSTGFARLSSMTIEGKGKSEHASGYRNKYLHELISQD